MAMLSSSLYYLMLMASGIFLIIGIKKDKINYIVSALWLSVLALLLHYQAAGGEILGSYFGYKNATIYGLNLIVMIITIICLFLKVPLFKHKKIRIITTLFTISIILGGLILIINLSINALFIENRRFGTPILQVATFKINEYCGYRYIFYKVANDGKINYMCPDHYLIFPSTGVLDTSPEYVLKNLLIDLQNKNVKK